MIYQYEQILWSDADMVVCPTRCDEEIIEGSLHEKMVCLLPPGYMKKHFDAITGSGGTLVPGTPIVYYVRDDDWQGRWVVDFPVWKGMTYQQYRMGVLEILRIANQMNPDAVAVPHPMPGVRFSEDLQEECWRMGESLVLAGSECQVQLFTEEEEVLVLDEDTQVGEVAGCLL